MRSGTVFLADRLSDEPLDSEHLSEHLAEILQDNLPEDQADSAQRLADRYARNEASGIDKVNGLSPRIGLDNDPVLANARVCKAKELVQEYVRRKPAALKLIHKLLTHAGESMETFMAEYSPRNSAKPSGSIV